MNRFSHVSTILAWAWFLIFLLVALFDVFLFQVGYAGIFCLVGLTVFSCGALLSNLIFVAWKTNQWRSGVLRILLSLIPVLFLYGQFSEVKDAERQSYFPASLTLRMSLALYDSYMRLEFARSEWDSASNKRLKIYGARVRTEKLNEQLRASTDFLELVERETGLTQLAPVTVVRSPGNFGHGEALFRFANSSHADEFRAVDRHELAHMFINQHVELLASPPQSLAEGWAIYWEDGDAGLLYQSLQEHIEVYGEINLVQWLTTPLANVREDESYLIGGPLVHFLISEFGISRFCDVYIECTPENFSDVCMKYFGEDLETIAVRFLRKVKQIPPAVDMVLLDGVRFANSDVRSSWESYVSSSETLASTQNGPLRQNSELLTIKRRSGPNRFSFDFAQWISFQGRMLHFQSGMNGEMLFAVDSNGDVVDAVREDSNSDWKFDNTAWGLGKKNDLLDRFRRTQSLLRQASICNFVSDNSPALTIVECLLVDGRWEIAYSLEATNAFKESGTILINPVNPSVVDNLKIQRDWSGQIETIEYSYSWEDDSNGQPSSIGCCYDPGENETLTFFDVLQNRENAIISTRYTELLSGAPIIRPQAPSFRTRNSCWAIAALFFLVLICLKILSIGKAKSDESGTADPSIAS